MNIIPQSGNPRGVCAHTGTRGLCLESVTLCNDQGKILSCFSKRMEVHTAPAATGPWTSVVAFTSQQTTAQQTFTVAPGAPVIGGFVQVDVHDNYGFEITYTSSMSL